ncbi:TolB family protein [Nocardioides zeicaulis]|uniref:TolB family protein n=1 Tax=Nocardioides zeicaulis TaxID=1776857 RepID=A0ABV6DYS0_9ACTN
MNHRTPKPRRVLTTLAAAFAAGLSALSAAPTPAGAASSPAVAAAPAHARPVAARARALDGRIAFVRDGQVWSMSRWGGDVRKLTSSGTNSHPQWSPDGRRIAYLHEADGRRDIWVMASGGSRKRAVTTTGDVTSDGATWAPGGERLAYADSLGQLVTIGSRAPYGPPEHALSYRTGGFCDEGDTGSRDPVPVTRYLSWSPDGRIAVVNRSDCYFDDRLDHYYVATQELRQYDASGADCCGYREWSDLFWGPDSQFGYTLKDTGQYGEDVDAPLHIVYPGFRSLDGDTGGAPSPSGAFLALSTTRDGTPVVVRARADGYGRNVLAVGSQPDWQVLPR